MGEVYPNLMRPSRLEHDLEPGVTPVAFEHPVVRDRGLAASLHRHAGATCAVPPDRRVHGPVRRWRAGDHGFVDPLHLARLDLGDEASVRGKGSCDEHEPGGVLVQAVNEAGARNRP